MRLKSLEAMTAQTLLSFVRIPTVLVETLSGDSYPVMASSVIVTFGLATNALEAVQCIMEALIALHKASVRHTVVAVFRAAATLVSGVNMVVVMVQ